MFICYLCESTANLISKPSATSSYIECPHCLNYIIEDKLTSLSKQVRNSAARYSHNHKRYLGETLKFYQITRTYKECPDHVYMLSCRVNAP